MAEQQTTEQRLEQVAAALNERVATVHERQWCPTCFAPPGVRCRSMPAGYVVGIRGGGSGRVLKNSHRARIEREVPLR